MFVAGVGGRVGSFFILGHCGTFCDIHPPYGKGIQGLSIVSLNCDFSDSGIYMIGNHPNPNIL